MLLIVLGNVNNGTAEGNLFMNRTVSKTVITFYFKTPSFRNHIRRIARCVYQGPLQSAAAVLNCGFSDRGSADWKKAVPSNYLKIST